VENYFTVLWQAWAALAQPSGVICSKFKSGGGDKLTVTRNLQLGTGLAVYESITHNGMRKSENICQRHEMKGSGFVDQDNSYGKLLHGFHPHSVRIQRNDEAARR
jgi:hypothetical protein